VRPLHCLQVPFGQDAPDDEVLVQLEIECLRIDVPQQAVDGLYELLRERHGRSDRRAGTSATPGRRTSGTGCRMRRLRSPSTRLRRRPGTLRARSAPPFRAEMGRSRGSPQGPVAERLGAAVGNPGRFCGERSRWSGARRLRGRARRLWRRARGLGHPPRRLREVTSAARAGSRARPASRASCAWRVRG